MKLARLLFLCLLVFTLNTAEAQDIHFTQFDMSPISLNPALSGAFKGTVRIGGIYRDQWASVIDNPYRTPSFYIDVPAFRGIGKKDWIGIGASLINDQSGSANLSNLIIGGNLAYHWALDDKRKNVLTIAGGYSQVQRRFDQQNLVFGNQINSGTIDTNLPTGEGTLDDNKSYGDYQAGLAFRSKPKAGLEYTIGFSSFNIAETEEGFVGNGTRARRYVGHATADIDLKGDWKFRPQVLYQTQAGTEELIANLLFGYELNENTVLNFGPGYRLDDAAMILLGIDYKNLRAGVSYDFNVSDLSAASNSQGGFEIGVGYIIRIPKVPTIPPVIFSPRF